MLRNRPKIGLHRRRSVFGGVFYAVPRLYLLGGLKKFCSPCIFHAEKVINAVIFTPLQRTFIRLNYGIRRYFARLTGVGGDVMQDKISDYGKNNYCRQYDANGYDYFLFCSILAIKYFLIILLPNHVASLSHRFGMRPNETCDPPASCLHQPLRRGADHFDPAQNLTTCRRE